MLVVTKLTIGRTFDSNGLDLRGQFSGGRRRRIGVARAPALNPNLIICDEAVSALDVSIRGHVINLLQDLQKEFGLTYSERFGESPLSHAILVCLFPASRV
ncbi:MAG: ATP-binding cassette domain-containing protein [Deltaproteobacteria bacterium]|nr:MAG: ATP-binding cassette domain-containing protein [Deltaproteobacteria bacterium]